MAAWTALTPTPTSGWSWSPATGAFCAGTDLAAKGAGATFRYPDPARHVDGAGVLALRIFESTKPVIGAWRMLGADHPMAAHEVESRLLGTLGSAPDAVEGVQAFLEKRPAKFPGRVPADLPDWYPWWAPRPFEPVP